MNVYLKYKKMKFKVYEFDYEISNGFTYFKRLK